MSSLLIPKVIGHRGAKAYAPENTLASIHTAADLGIEWVEIDVKLTKDGVPVIFHDEELERCTGVSGLMADKTWAEVQEMDAGSWFGDSFIGEKIPSLDKTWAEVQEMDAGSWFGDSFIGEKIPSLEQALNAIIDRGLGLNLEIKPCPGREKETAEAALDVATRIWPEDGPQPLISSFQHVSLETAMDMIEEWPRGFLMDDHLENWKELAEYLQVHTININGNARTREEIEEYIELQKPILAYTINDPLRAQELMRWGVDAVFADNPDIIRDAVETKH